METHGSSRKLRSVFQDGDVVSDEINKDRRRFLATAAMTFAAAQFGKIDFAKAQSTETNRSLGTLKQIDAGVLMLDMRKQVLRMVVL
jgi:hypothetical protein